MIDQGSFRKNSNPRLYSLELNPISSKTRSELILLAKIKVQYEFLTHIKNQITDTVLYSYFSSILCLKLFKLAIDLYKNFFSDTPLK